MAYPDDTAQQEEYSDAEEYQDNFVDAQRDLWEEQTGMDYPVARRPESLFGLFKKVWATEDSSKVANLDKEELGHFLISVRDSQRIALLANLLHHENFAKYFANIGEVTLSTSMSKKGWFVELFVTSKKFAHKSNLPGLQGMGQGQQSKQKWRLFGGANNQTQTSEEE